jgi:hypothetical protein
LPKALFFPPPRIETGFFISELGRPTRSHHQVSCGERDVHQRGVFENGECGRKEDEEGKENEWEVGRRLVIMKSLMGVLVGGAIVLFVFSCVTVPKKPLASGELRLLSMDVVGSGVDANTSFPINVFFESAGTPEIKRACFYESGEETFCFDVSLATFGTKRYFQVYLLGMNVGSHTVECYAEYIHGGEIQKTNVITTRISVGVAAGAP